MSNVIEIEGIGEVYSRRLHDAGVGTTDALLSEGATPQGRDALASKTGIARKRILRWVNRADLFRIHGVAEQYSDLLAAAGVETVLELAQRKAKNLHQKMAQTNEARKLVRHLPQLEQVEAWIEEARNMPRVVSY
jgi:predicted flap endonuclease-1-like 5' DNA nuclease